MQLINGRRAAYMISGLAAMLILLFSGGLASAAEPQIQASTCQGAELKFPIGAIPHNACAFVGNRPETKLNNLVATIVNLFSVFVGIIAVLMIIVGGFRYITSGGDSGNVSSAKNTILYAIVGLVIVALAQFIVKFVLAKATGIGT